MGFSTLGPISRVAILYPQLTGCPLGWYSYPTNSYLVFHSHLLNAQLINNISSLKPYLSSFCKESLTIGAVKTTILETILVSTMDPQDQIRISKNSIWNVHGG